MRPHGKQLDVADYKGKVVVMNVWGSWCAPCRAEAPYFDQGRRGDQEQGRGVRRDQHPRPADQPGHRLREGLQGRVPELHDPIGKLVVNGFPKGELNPQSIPTTIVLDREGKIAARALSRSTTSGLRNMIDPLVAEK